MTATAIRKKIHQYIDSADEQVVKAVYAMLKELDKAPADMKRFSIEEYNESIEKAEREIAAGKFLTHKEALKQISKW
ncbi:MAG: hypothetical protein ACOZCO_11610 [Bacteroidota bacterium]